MKNLAHHAPALHEDLLKRATPKEIKEAVEAGHLVERMYGPKKCYVIGSPTAKQLLVGLTLSRAVLGKGRAKVSDGRLIGDALGVELPTALQPWILAVEDSVERVYRAVVVELNARKDSMKRSLEQFITRAESHEPLKRALNNHVLGALVLVPSAPLAKTVKTLASENWPKYRVLAEVVTL
jgi:hypothetical protein